MTSQPKQMGGFYAHKLIGPSTIWLSWENNKNKSWWKHRITKAGFHFFLFVNDFSKIDM